MNNEISKSALRIYRFDYVFSPYRSKIKVPVQSWRTSNPCPPSLSESQQIILMHVRNHTVEHIKNTTHAEVFTLPIKILQSMYINLDVYIVLQDVLINGKRLLLGSVRYSLTRLSCSSWNLSQYHSSAFDWETWTTLIKLIFKKFQKCNRSLTSNKSCDSFDKIYFDWNSFLQLID